MARLVIPSLFHQATTATLESQVACSSQPNGCILRKPLKPIPFLPFLRALSKERIVDVSLESQIPSRRAPSNRLIGHTSPFDVPCQCLPLLSRPSHSLGPCRPRQRPEGAEALASRVARCGNGSATQVSSRPLLCRPGCYGLNRAPGSSCAA